MKTFYTVRDIEDMHAAGAVEIEIHDDVVLTDVAREKAIALGMHLKAAPQDAGGRPGAAMSRASAAPANMASANPGTTPHAAVTPAAPSAAPGAGAGAAANAELVRKIKAAVVARLGTDKYDGLLDRIIPQVIAKIK